VSRMVKLGIQYYLQGWMIRGLDKVTGAHSSTNKDLRKNNITPEGVLGSERINGFKSQGVTWASLRAHTQ